MGCPVAGLPQKRIRQPRHCIGRARARGDHDHADLAAGAGVAGRHESRSLFVGRYDELHRGFLVGFDVVIVVAENGVVDGQNGTARIAEDRVHALVSQNLHDGVRTRHDITCERVLIGARRAGLLVHD